MLTALRSSAGSWVAKIFIGVLALSFAVWGIADVFRGSQTDVLATVGEHEITAEEFTQAFNRQVRSYSQRLGQPLTPDQARQIGLDRQVLSDLLSAGALEDQARQLRISVSDKAVAQRIADTPAFHNSRGEFDAGSFRRLLNANGLSEGEFLASERRQMTRNAIVSLLTEDVAVPDTLVEMIWRQRNERRDVAYFSIGADEADTPEPGEQDIKAYYDANPGQFAVPERRALVLIPVEPATAGKSAEVTEDEIKKIYDQRKDLFETPEKRVIEQIAFPSASEAQSAFEAIRAGIRSFEDTARDRGLKETELTLGEFTRTQFPDQTIAAEVFAVPEGEVSEPLKGRLSVVLVRASKITRGEQKSLDEVRDELAGLIRADKGREAVLDIYGKIEDARAGGSTLEEIASSMNLPLVKIDRIDRSGILADGSEADIPNRAEVLAAAFDSDVGVENDPVPTRDDGFVWVDVREIFPAAAKPLDQVREQAIEGWKAAERRKAVLAKAGELASQARGGANFEQLALKSNATIRKLRDIKRNEATVEFDGAAVQALFQAPPDGFAVAADNDGRHAKVIRSTPVLGEAFNPSSDEAKAIRNVLESGLGGDLFSQYVGDVQAQSGMKINDALWQRLSGGGT